MSRLYGIKTIPAYSEALPAGTEVKQQNKTTYTAYID